MHRRFPILVSIICIVLVMSSLSGCTFIFQKGRRQDIAKITKLKTEISDLERAKQELEDRLRNEIADRQVAVEMSERGLVITFVAEVLFDSGKAKLKAESLEKLSKVARVLQTTVRDLSVGVEGHTDNVPIKFSGWKSNWELSSARALSVVHYLIDDNGVAPERLSAIGYGEFHPVAENSTVSGRQKNRRVEIIILPAVDKKAAVVEGSENLK